MPIVRTALTIEKVECVDWLEQASVIKQVLALMHLIHPHVKRSQELLRWQYFAAPGAPGQIYALKDTERIVSIYCTVPSVIQINGRRVKARRAQDLMTHPDYRNRGCMHELVRACFDDMRRNSEIAYGFPNSLALKAQCNIGWTAVCPLPHRFKAIGHLASPAEIEMLDTDSFDGSISDVWEKAGFSVAIVRDARYLTWRYRKPHQAYHRFLIEKDKGVLILKVFNKDQDVLVHICELFVAEPDRDLLPHVVRFCEQYARALGATGLSAWIPRKHRYAAIFDAAGMSISGSDRYFIVSADDSFKQALNADAWNISHGDDDVY